MFFSVSINYCRDVNFVEWLCSDIKLMKFQASHSLDLKIQKVIFLVENANLKTIFCFFKRTS